MKPPYATGLTRLQQRPGILDGFQQAPCWLSTIHRHAEQPKSVSTKLCSGEGACDEGGQHLLQGGGEVHAQDGQTAADSPAVPQALAADTADRAGNAPAGTGTAYSNTPPQVAADVSSPVRSAVPQRTATAAGAPAMGAARQTVPAAAHPDVPDGTTAKTAATGAGTGAGTAAAKKPVGTTTAAAKTAAVKNATAKPATDTSTKAAADTPARAGSEPATATARARVAATGTAAGATAASAAEPAAPQARAAASAPATETPLTPLEPTTTDPAAPHDHATGSSPVATTPDHTTTRDTGTDPGAPAQGDGAAADPKPAAHPDPEPAPRWGTEVFTGTHVLRPGQSLASDRTHLTMRADGNLVITDENGAVRWSSHTSGQGDYAVLQSDGDLVVRTAAQQTLWSSGSGGHDGARLVLQNDGDVTILATDGRVLWAAGTQH